MNFILTAGETFARTFADFFAYIPTAFVGFGLIDVLDILFIGALLFFGYRFLSKKKAAGLMIGLGLFIAVLIVSSLLGMNVTSAVFRSIYDVGALALIIIFQPEIRESMERVGSGSIGVVKNISERRRHRRIYSEAIDNVCIAVRELSASKTGALIVLSRTIRLDDIISSGIRINADVNSYLLRNIFFNKAPLHDGAVVIDNARISAAGCLLPLTRRADVDSDLGTRHRAAIGMSEISDAVIVVVSEETGIISVAYDCNLTRDFTPETLKTYLLKKLLSVNSGQNNR